MKRDAKIGNDYASSVIVALCKQIHPFDFNMMLDYMQDKSIEYYDRPQEFFDNEHALKQCQELTEKLMEGTLEEAKAFIAFFDGTTPNVRIVIPACQTAKAGGTMEVLINDISHHLVVLGREGYREDHTYGCASYDETFTAKELLADTTGSVGQTSINYAIRTILLTSKFIKPISLVEAIIANKNKEKKEHEPATEDFFGADNDIDNIDEIPIINVTQIGPNNTVIVGDIENLEL